MPSELSKLSEFTYVPYRSRKKRGKNASSLAPPRSFTGSLGQTKRELEDSNYWQDCSAFVKTIPTLTEGIRPQRALCLGLGSPTVSRTSRAQLHLFLNILDSLNISYDRVVIYDPGFTPEDITGLIELGFHVDRMNTLGKYALEEPALVYMPHCGIRLNDNILRANWSPERLPRILLLSNDFKCYDESKTKQQLEVEAPCIGRMLPCLKTYPLPPSASSSTEFVSMAFQFLDRTTTPREGDSFWLMPPPATDSADGEVL